MTDILYKMVRSFSSTDKDQDSEFKALYESIMKSAPNVTEAALSFAIWGHGEEFRTYLEQVGFVIDYYDF